MAMYHGRKDPEALRGQIDELSNKDARSFMEARRLANLKKALADIEVYREHPTKTTLLHAGRGAVGGALASGAALSAIDHAKAEFARLRTK